MRILRHTAATFASQLRKLDRRHVPSTALQTYVAEILQTVRERGDAALCEYAQKFDAVTLTPKQLLVTEKEFAAAEKSVSDDVKAALAASHKNVLAFARKSLRKDWKMKNAQGADVGEVFQPFQRVGIYVPGGTAPLVSTVLMTVTLAQAAGCPEIVVCTPCGKDGSILPDMLVALRMCGATQVCRVGGAHGIAGLAWGTKTLAPVDKILGPGNKFVVEAKRQLFGAVSIDLLPGPSEVMVIADDSAEPAFIAADLLAQAEHGKDSQVLFATPSEKLLAAVQAEVAAQLKVLPRAAMAKESLDTGGTLVLTKDLDQAVALCNAWAPEHLSLIVDAKIEAQLVPQICSAGAIFLGNYSPVAAGDFLAGPSHTLPTGGAGKSFPGLTVDMFQRRTSIVRLSREAMRRSAPIVEKFAAMEGLAAHGRSASIRLER